MNTGKNRFVWSIVAALAPFSGACGETDDPQSEEVTETVQALAITPTNSAIGYQQFTDNKLAETGPKYTGTTKGVMKSGASPSIAAMDGGNYKDAFQGKDGYLWINGSGGPVNQWLGMDSKSSPSIAGLIGGGYEVAFQANDHNLYITGKGGYARDQGYGMTPGTSPSIAAFPGGHWEVAFNANANNGTNSNTLWILGSLATYPTWLPMAPGTSPSIAAQADGTWQVAYQGHDNVLHVYDPAIGHTNKGYAMDPTSSPSITAVPSGGFQIAYQASSQQKNTLWIYGPLGSRDLGLGMMPGTSPSITAPPSGGWSAAFQANTGNLWIAGAQTGDTKAKIDAKSSPSICSYFAAPAITGKVTSNGTNRYGEFNWKSVPGVTKYTQRRTCNGVVEYGDRDLPSYETSNNGWLQSPGTTCLYTLTAHYRNGFRVDSNTVSLKVSGNGVGVYYYLELSTGYCNSQTMSGSLSPGRFASSTSTGSPADLAYCPGITSGQCCSFYLGASNLASGSYTMSISVPGYCSNTQTFNLAADSAKQFSGYGVSCPTAKN
jgi:hypothetical protein